MQRLLSLVALTRASLASSFLRLLVIAASFVLVGLCYLALYDIFGPIVGMLSMVPIGVAVYYFGIAGGILGALAAIPLNAIGLATLGERVLIAPSTIAVSVAMLLFGILSGLIRNTRVKDRESRDLLTIAFEAAQDGLWDYRIADDEVYFSPRWFTMLGYKPNEFPHSFDTWVTLIHPDDSEHALARVAEVIEQGRPQFAVSFRMHEKGGGYRWILSRGKIVDYDRRGRARRMVGVHSDISELKRAENEIVQLAYHDPLTGMPNRKSFYQRLEQILEQQRRLAERQYTALMHIDIDNFREINEGFGHHLGDELLVQAAARLSEQIRKSDLLFRLGADEFVVIATHLQRPTDAAQVAENLISALAAPFVLNGGSVYTGISVGIAVHPKDANEASDLIRAADSALYEAKRDRNTYRFHAPEMQDEALGKMRVLNDLRRAVSENEFRLVYQPMIDARGAICGAEALVRWQDPERGLRSPLEFIGLAEESGLILPIGSWVLNQATADAVAWQALGLGALPVSVNLSPKQLRSSGIVNEVELALATSDLDPSLLCLELTEGSLLDPDDEAGRRLSRFTDLGVKIAIDDFGTGYSSMSYLKRLPVHRIKVDRSFVIGLPDNREDVSITEAILTMADGLGLSVTAEGVDNAEQVAFLRKHGCGCFQGYYFARPMSGDDFAAFLEHAASGAVL